MTRRLISILIVYSWGSIFGQGESNRSSPINIAVKEGEVAAFECKASVAIDSWSFTPVGSSTPVTFYHRRHGKLSNLTSFDNSTSPDGRVSVKTKSVRMEDAGIYECNFQQTNGSEPIVTRKSAQLIVLASEPRCWRDDSDDRFRCSVDFRGNWDPFVEWRKEGPDGQEATGGLQSVVINNQSLIAILSVGDKETSVSSVICRISFSFNGSSTGATADNVPKYTPICPNSDRGSTSTRVSSTGDDSASKTEATNLADNKLFQIIIATGAVACILFIILIFVSTRNFRKYRTAKRVSPRSENLPKFKEADSFVKVSSSITLSDRELQKLGREKCIGADGTVYMEMGNVDNNMNSLSRSNLHPSHHEMTIYASIDHSIRPLAYPPPPPPPFLPSRC